MDHHDLDEVRRSGGGDALTDTALRDSESRLRFLGELDRRLLMTDDPGGAMRAATEQLGRRLKVSRCAYADVDADNDRFWIRSDYNAPGVPSSAGEYSLDLFGPRAAADMRTGQTLVVRDVAGELEPGAGCEMFQAIGINAIICCPLVRKGRLAAMMAVHNAAPRDWTASEVELVREVVDRCWAHIERVGAQARLRESEERLRLAVDNAEVGFWDVDVVNDLLIWPPRTKAMFGISPDVPVTMQDFYDGLHPDDRDVTSAAFGGAADPKRRALYDVEYRTVGKEDGVVRWVAAKGRGVFDGAGRCLRVAGTAIDVTQRKIGEAALAASEARLRELNETLERRVAERTEELAASERRFRAIFNTTFQLTGLATVDGDIVVVNQAALDAVSARQEDVVGLKMWDSPWWKYSEDERRMLQAGVARVAQGDFVRYESTLWLPDGTHRLFDFSMKPVLGDDGRPTGLVAEGRDITDQRRAEDQLRQAQKMEAMGQLTGGVAHDFNNLLTPIVGALDMLQRRGLGGEREQRLIGGAVQSADRAKTLVQRLLAFARRQPLRPVPVDIAKLVTGMGDLVATTIGPQIRVVVEAAEDLPAAAADPNQLEMALLNLAVNARDAMPGGGVLRISASTETVRPGHYSKLPAGQYVRLSVVDTGEGMDEATLARAVEPFFSTKGVGKGTGLGLSMVHGLASQLEGALTIQSKLGLGTNVELWLPRSTTRATEETRPTQFVRRPANQGVALLVDDEELVRASVADMLSDLGYTVIEAASGEEAIRLVEMGRAFDLLVSDHLMPGVNGADLARAVQSSRPDAAVLLVSGYAEREDLDPDLPRLTKPFRKDELAATLAQLVAPSRADHPV